MLEQDECMLLTDVDDSKKKEMGFVRVRVLLFCGAGHICIAQVLPGSALI
jgi:hypothetical protein